MGRKKKKLGKGTRNERDHVLFLKRHATRAGGEESEEGGSGPAAEFCRKTRIVREA